MATAPPPMRFGVCLSPCTSRDEWVDKARRAEALGFDVALAADHVAGAFPPLTSLAFAAEATARLRIGTNVLNNDFRHPVLVARDAATLALLSDGRFELGLGAGHAKREYDALGIPFDPPGVRIDRLGESVRLIKGLLAGETMDGAGRHYRVAGATGFPVLDHDLPRTSPHGPVPILIGGNGDRLLRLAAREADIINFSGFSMREGTAEPDLNRFSWAGLTAAVAAARAGAPERFERIERSVLVQAVVAGDDRRAVARSLPWPEDDLAIDARLDSPFLVLGSRQDRVDHLRRLRDEHGVSYLTVFDHSMDATAEIIGDL